MTEILDSAELSVEEEACLALGGTDRLPGGVADPDMAEAVPIQSVLPGESPRISGENAGHTNALRERLPDLPAILVNRRTMQVVDGMHRLSAAKQQGADMIRVRFVDVSQHEAFLLSVRANMDHGLPLSLADREAAALRILQWHASWSDRAIADVVGLAASTLAAIRKRSTDRSQQSNARMGRDGRIRPMSTLDGRLRASEILAARPGTPLREVALEAGVSLGTAHDVRDRMRRGDHPIPDRQRPDQERASSQCDRRGLPRRRRRGELVAWPSLRPRLMRDPLVRYSVSGQELLRWLDSHTITPQSWQGIVNNVPPHWADSVVGVAYSCADQWQEVAQALERRIEAMNASAASDACPREAKGGAA